MKYSFSIFATIVIGLGVMSCKKTGSDSGIEVAASAPSVTTTAASNIAGTSATVGGIIPTDNGSIITEAGIVYSTTANVDTTKNRKKVYTAGGNFSVPLTGLSLLTTYYYRAYAINEKGITYGEEKSFFVPISGYSVSGQLASANLIGYWGFNGSYIDSVSKVVGTAVHPTAISFVQGIIGQAVQVKSPGYINTNVAGTIAALKSFTITCWIQQPASLATGPTTYMPFSLNKAGYSWEQTKFFTLFESDNATNSYGKVGLMDQWFDKGRVWPKMLDGKWHQLVISYDGDTGAVRVYVDGAMLAESSTAKFNPQSNFGDADSFTLGGPDDNANTTNGWMNSLSGNLDEVRIFNKVLTADEILILYTLQSHGF